MYNDLTLGDLDLKCVIRNQRQNALLNTQQRLVNLKKQFLYKHLEGTTLVFAFVRSFQPASFVLKSTC